MNNTGTVDYGTMIAGTMVRHDDDMGGNTGTMVVGHDDIQQLGHDGCGYVVVFEREDDGISRRVTRESILKSFDTLSVISFDTNNDTNITLEHNRYDDKAYFR